MWGGRFTQPTNKLVEAYTASLAFDRRLAEEDIRGSLAHVHMLGKIGVLTQDEVTTISDGLQNVQQKIAAGDVTYDVADEDIHMSVEKWLTEAIGPLGGKLHTGRSRNDQVALDLHLYVRRATVDVVRLTAALQEALLAQAEAHVDTVLPGYTHLQRAQPIRFAHHLLAYVAMFGRDIARLIDSYARVDVCPLGAGALAGASFPLDRHMVAEELAFADLYDNSIDAVSDRDFVVEFLSGCALLMTHLSRLCEELVLWSSQEFAFIELDDAFCTGSSIMPQKKNPDVAELVRGKTGRVYGNLVALLTVLKGLPLAYNKDMQEDKEGLFDTVDTVVGALKLMAPMMATMRVNGANMRQAVEQDFSNATDLADYLVRKNIPFRQAHEIVGKTVLYCIAQQKFLLDLSLDEFRQFAPKIGNDVYEALAIERVVDARDVYGGPAREQVEIVIEKRKSALSETEQWLKHVNL
ncbi:argininosuccinate lyase [Numidum massiliense]|uniref:argininosuccinate lyase n=1 Tax=Numidum massiliense TaxID=1522315 RepID=UPI00093F192A|nr:argininosuccinate lyase [Numidum massiliense]